MGPPVSLTKGAGNSSLSDTEKQEALSEIVQLGETDWREEAKNSARKVR